MSFYEKSKTFSLLVYFILIILILFNKHFIVTAALNTAIQLYFLACTFCENTQFPKILARFIWNSEETPQNFHTSKIVYITVTDAARLPFYICSRFDVIKLQKTSWWKKRKNGSSHRKCSMRKEVLKIFLLNPQKKTFYHRAVLRGCFLKWF